MKDLGIDEVQRRLRLVTGLENHVDPLAALLSDVRAWLRPIPLGEWVRSPGSYSTASHGENRFRIIEREKPVLEYEWLDRGRRTLLSTGAVDELAEHAKRIAASGGPRGGPSVGDPKRRPVALTRWIKTRESDDALVGSVGGGFEFRVRPVHQEHVLALVSPRGSVAILGQGGSHDLTSQAVYAFNDLKPWDDELPEDYFPPLSVSLRGVATKLIYTPIRGVIGYARVEETEAFALTLGVDDFALVTSSAGSTPTCIHRWWLSDIRTWELSPPEPVNLEFERPSFPHPDAVANSIASMNTLAEPVRHHLCELVDDSRKKNGARGVRGILWLIAAKHQLGQRTQKVGGRDELIEWLYASAAFKAPGVRSRRGALTWLLPRTPFLQYVRIDGQMRWIVRFDWLKLPPTRILNALSSA